MSFFVVKNSDLEFFQTFKVLPVSKELSASDLRLRYKKRCIREEYSMVTVQRNIKLNIFEAQYFAFL